jgi:hypothetical protein
MSYGGHQKKKKKKKKKHQGRKKSTNLNLTNLPSSHLFSVLTVFRAHLQGSFTLAPWEQLPCSVCQKSCVDGMKYMVYSPHEFLLAG